MKKLFILAFAAIGLLACSDKNSIDENASVVGKWYSEKVIEYYVENGKQETDVEYMISMLDINADHSFKIQGDVYDAEGTWAQNDKALIFFTSGASYSLRTTIQKLTAKELVLRSESYEGYEDEYEEWYFVRQN